MPDYHADPEYRKRISEGVKRAHRFKEMMRQQATPKKRAQPQPLCLSCKTPIGRRGPGDPQLCHKPRCREGVAER